MRHDHRFYAATAIGVGAVVVAVVTSRSRRAPGADSDPAEPTGPVVAWCADGLEPIAGGGCLAMPHDARRRGPVPLVVYLHGRYSPETAPQEMARQARVASLGTKRGFAVLALRGRQGQCSDPSLASFWCWPSNERSASDAPRYVDEWATPLRVAERRAGRGRRLLLGFSSGAYFATIVATRGLHPFDAVAIAHGGPVEPTAASAAMPPLVLLTADDDPSNEEMLRLDDELRRVRWPHHVFAREGGHELPDADVEAALTFFARTEKEKLPLRPPISLRAPRHTPPDAGAGVDAAATADGAEAQETRSAVEARVERDAALAPPAATASASAQPPADATAIPESPPPSSE